MAEHSPGTSPPRIATRDPGRDWQCRRRQMTAYPDWRRES